MTPEELTGIGYHPDHDMALDHARCFLCGVSLEGSNRTVEHVFAKWMQEDFDLWNQKLWLRNGTSIRYRQLTIPCCKTCNEVWLADVEDQVSHAIREGTAAVRDLDQTVLCLWMAKIYYGLQFKELQLAQSRRDPSGAKLLDPPTLRRQSELHHLLQVVRGDIRLRRTPGSPRIFEAQVPAESRDRFDYRDLRVAPYLALRLGPTVVVASLLDWGIINQFPDPYLDLAAQLELHPAQFPEVAAHAAYRAMRFNARFAMLTIPSTEDADILEPVLVAPTPQHLPRLRPFLAREFTVVFHEYTGLGTNPLFRTV